MRYWFSLLLLIFFAGHFQLHAADKNGKKEDVTFDYWVALMEAGYARTVQRGNKKNPSSSDLSDTLREITEMQKIKTELLAKGKNREEEFVNAFTEIVAQQETKKKSQIK